MDCVGRDFLECERSVAYEVKGTGHGACSKLTSRRTGRKTDIRIDGQTDKIQMRIDQEDVVGG